MTVDPLAEAITAAVDGTLVTNYVVLAEVIDDDGDKTFQSFTSGALPMWSAIGMADLFITSRKHQAMFAEDD